jgi:hypothetical protein
MGETGSTHGEIRDTFRILMGTLDGNRCRCVANITMYFKIKE